MGEEGEKSGGEGEGQNENDDEEEEIPEELPDPFSSNGQKSVAAPVNKSNKSTTPDVKNGHQPTNGKDEEEDVSASEENGKKKHHKKKKSRHQERIDELK